MNFEEYVQNMTQKYKLVVATSVLKNKPPNVTTEQYLTQLQEKIKRDQQEIDDFIASDDFEDDHLNFDDDLMIHGELPNDDNLSIDLLEKFDGSDINLTQIKDNHSTLLKDFKTPTKEADSNIFETTKENDVQCSTNSKEILINDEATTDSIEPTVTDILRIIRDINDNMEQDTQVNDAIQSTYWESSQITRPNILEDKNNFSADDQRMIICDDNDIVDIDMIICNDNETADMALDSDDHRLEFDNLILNEYSMKDNESKDKKIIANVKKNFNKTKTTSEKDKVHSKEKNITCVESNSIQDMNIDEININAFNEINTPTQNSLQLNLIKDKAAKIAKNIDKNKTADKETNDIYNNKQNVINNNILDSQATVIYSIDNLTQNYSQISQSQCQNIEVSKNFIVGNKNKHISDGANKLHLNLMKDNETSKELEPECSNNVHYSQNSIITNADTNKIEYIIDKEGKTYAVIHQINITNDNATANNIFDKEIQIENITDLQDNVIESIGTHKDDKRTIKIGNQITALNTNIKKIVNSEMITDITEAIIENHSDEDLKQTTEYTGTSQEVAESNAETELAQIGDVEPPSSQVVPFKVVKELSKIKAHLDRRERRISTDGFSSDSGYRSDSQHSSYKNVSAHLSENWLNQSADCLYEYLVTCPLMSTAHAIVSEISQTLGRLIDRMHEDETYPAFLDTLLKAIDKLLQEVYHSGGHGDTILLEKDEKIQRLLLLNKSTHILKFTIDKTATILQEIHASLTSKEKLYELVNIQEVENTSYIFYLLEILLKRYIKVKDLSQSTQSSQKVLNKSSITDIWRKKWNFVKEISYAGSQEKVCVLTKCGDILNKIIVECMDGYSLVCFAALQCYNILQS